MEIRCFYENLRFVLVGPTLIQIKEVHTLTIHVRSVEYNLLGYDAV
jgi:hypothetical protein